MTPDEVNHSQVGNVFMLGAGGIFGRVTLALDMAVYKSLTSTQLLY